MLARYLGRSLDELITGHHRSLRAAPSAERRPAPLDPGQVGVDQRLCGAFGADDSAGALQESVPLRVPPFSRSAPGGHDRVT